MSGAVREFRFETSSVLVRLTDRRARSLQDLLDGLRAVSGSAVHQHTFHASRERHFVPEVPQNDFAYWVGEVLRTRPLGEKLAAVDPYDFTDIRSLRNALIEVIEDHLKTGGDDARAPSNREFHFMESVSVIIPLPEVAHDLREFRECLASIPLRSIAHHFLEARLRLGRRTNDFSVWLSDDLGARELAESFERIDVGISTLEDARAQMLELVDRQLARQRMRVGFGLLGSAALAAATGIFRFLRSRRPRGYD